jgi:hypothetical protein
MPSQRRFQSLHISRTKGSFADTASPMTTGQAHEGLLYRSYFPSSSQSSNSVSASNLVRLHEVSTRHNGTLGPLYYAPFQVYVHTTSSLVHHPSRISILQINPTYLRRLIVQIATRALAMFWKRAYDNARGISCKQSLLGQIVECVAYYSSSLT